MNPAPTSEPISLAPPLRVLIILGRALRGCGRFIFSRKVFYLLGLIPVVLAIAWLMINRQGASDWQRVQADMAKRGMSFAELNLPPVCPASENLAMHPVFAPAMKLRDGKPITLQNPPVWQFSELTTKYAVSLPAGSCDLTSYRKTLLADASLPIEAKIDPDAYVLAKTDGLAELVTGLNEAAARPHTQWAPYEVSAGMPDVITDRPFVVMQSLFEFTTQHGDWLSLRAQAQLATGKPSDARETVLAMIHLGEIGSKEERYSLVNGLVEIAMEGVVLPKLEPCLQSPNWTETDLKEIAAALEQNEVSKAPAKALRYELLWSMRCILDGAHVPQIAAALTKGKLASWSSAGKYAPSGWLEHNAVALYDAEVTHFLDPAMTDGCAFGGYPRALMASTMMDALKIGMAAQACPALSNVIESARRAQLIKDKLRLRCLLAAHQMSTGQPAASLSALVPAFLKSVPVDHSSAKPITLADVTSTPLSTP